MSKKLPRIAIFASGSGTNAEAIAEYGRNQNSFEVAYLITNRRTAYVVNRAKKLNIEIIYLNKDNFYQSEELLISLNHIDLIVLAGFLWLIPDYLIRAFPNRILNVHPALLPQYGGKGMYGKHVHEAVFSNQESISGISIHFVNEKYDEGKIIFQATCDLEGASNAAEIAERVQKLEHQYYPITIEKVLEELKL